MKYKFNINTTSNRLFQKKIQTGGVEDFSTHISSTDKPHTFMLYNLYNLFSANRSFPLHVVILISKNFNLNVHALLVVLHLAIKYTRNRSTAIKSFIGLWKWQKFF